MGWHLISPNAPFPEGVDYSKEETVKSVVLLSDGAQTVGGFGPSGGFSISQANLNTRSLCAGIKAAGIRMITVAFDLNDGPAKQLLKDCASNPTEYFFDATTTSDLASVFKTITSGFRKPVQLIN